MPSKSSIAFCIFFESPCTDRQPISLTVSRSISILYFNASLMVGARHAKFAIVVIPVTGAPARSALQ